jgi:hypothetical protein
MLLDACTTIHRALLGVFRSRSGNAEKHHKPFGRILSGLLSEFMTTGLGESYSKALLEEF